MSNELAVQQSENPFTRASTALSQQLGLEPRAMVDAIKTQFFKGKEATDAQLAVVVSTARALGLNPLLPGQLYPYPDRSGAVTIMLGPDGIFTLLANNPEIVAQKDGGAAYWTEHGKDGEKETCTGFINHRTKGLLKKTIWVDEWVVGTNPNWAARRHHMAEVRALKQAARMVIHGIPPDSDEQKLSEIPNVTGTGEEAATPEAAPERPAPRPRAPRGAAGAKSAEVVVPAEEPAPKPIENIQQAMEAREAKTVAPQSAVSNEAPTGSPIVATSGNPVPSNPAPAATSTATPVSRAFIAEGEKLEVVAKVETMQAVKAKIAGQDIAAIKATLSGGFVGEVRQKEGGAKFVNNGAEVVALPPWQVGATLKFALVGEKSTAPASSPMHGKVIAWVSSVVALAQEAENLD